VECKESWKIQSSANYQSWKKHEVGILWEQLKEVKGQHRCWKELTKTLKIAQKMYVWSRFRPHPTLILRLRDERRPDTNMNETGAQSKISTEKGPCCPSQMYCSDFQLQFAEKEASIYPSHGNPVVSGISIGLRFWLSPVGSTVPILEYWKSSELEKTVENILE